MIKGMLSILDEELVVRSVTMRMMKMMRMMMKMIERKKDKR